MNPHLCAQCGRLFEYKAEGRIERLERLPIEEHVRFGLQIRRRWCSMECFVLDKEKELVQKKKVEPAR